MSTVTHSKDISNSSSVLWLGFIGAAGGMGRLYVRYKSNSDKVYVFNDALEGAYQGIVDGNTDGSVGKSLSSYRKTRPQGAMNGDIKPWGEVAPLFAGAAPITAAEKQQALSAWDEVESDGWFSVGFCRAA